MSGLRIIEPRSAEEMEAFRRLNWDYRDYPPRPARAP
jgi:hypothetical protein